MISGIKHTREINVTQEEIDAWQKSGRLIQAAFPHLSSDDREFILTGATPEEWNIAFEDDEDEYDPSDSGVENWQ